MRSDAVAIVPAGGRGRRLGALAAGGKAALVAGGRTFIDRVCTALVVEVSRVIVVAAPNGAGPVSAPAVEVIHDRDPGAGPLAAVRDGLVHARVACGPNPPPRIAILCSCDVPLVTPGLVRLLLDRASEPGIRWVLPVVGGHPQYLVSALAVDVLPVIERLLAGGHSSFHDLAAALGGAGSCEVLHLAERELRAVDPTLDSFRDVDTPEDLAQVVSRVAKRPPGA